MAIFIPLLQLLLQAACAQGGDPHNINQFVNIYLPHSFNPNFGFSYPTTYPSKSYSQVRDNVIALGQIAESSDVYIDFQKVQDPIQLQDLQLVKLLGKGGSGRVFLVEDRKRRKQYVLKSILKGGSKSKAKMLHKAVLDWEAARLIKAPQLLSYFFKSNKTYQVYQPVLNAVGSKYEFRSRAQIKFVIYQLLNQLRVLHENGFMHKDLKKANFLYSSIPVPKAVLIDFNLADFYVEGREYLRCGTIGYYSPQSLSNYSFQTPATDVWTAAVYMVRLGVSNMFFDSGSNSQNLISHIQFLGSEAFFSFVKKYNIKIEDERVLEYAETHLKPSFTLQSLLAKSHKQIDRQFIGIVQSMLKFDPAERPTCAQLLKHPYFDQLFSTTRWENETAKKARSNRASLLSHASSKSRESALHQHKQRSATKAEQKQQKNQIS